LGRLAFRGFDQEGNMILEQKRVDIMLGTDLVELAATKQISTAVLVAGDSDYIPAIEKAKRHGVQIWLYHSPAPHAYHDELWESCDERHAIDRQLIETVLR